MKPYWSSDDGRYILYCGDCLEVLSVLCDVSIDAVVTDFPYGVGFRYDVYDDAPELHRARVQLWLSALQARVSGPICIFSGVRQMWDYPPPHWVLSWRKTFSVNRSPFGANNWEPVLVYNKGRHAERHSDSFEATFTPDKDAVGHPCPKPVKAMQEVILRASLPNETILDAFAGSGSCGVACIRTGRKFIGIELSEAYCAVSVKRMEKELAQPSIFPDYSPNTKNAPGNSLGI